MGTTRSGWEQEPVLASGSHLHDLDRTHVGAPLRLSSQERRLFLNQLDLQLFIYEVMESAVLLHHDNVRAFTFIVIYFREDSRLFIKFRELFFGKYVGCNHLKEAEDLHDKMDGFESFRRKNVSDQTCLISHFSRSVVFFSLLRSVELSCISKMVASTGRSGFLNISSPTPESAIRLRLGFRSSPVT